MNMNKQIKVIVIGSKNFNYSDYEFFEEKMYEVLEKYFEEDYNIILREQEITKLDGFVVRFAKENNCELERCKIKWDIFGKKAAYENIKILVWGEKGQSGADLLICFFNKLDNESEKIMMLKIIEEFKSSIDISLSLSDSNYFIFNK